MKKLIALFFVLTAGLCCTKEEPLCGCTLPDSSFRFIIKDKSNNDLLKTGNAGAFAQSSISLKSIDGSAVSKNIFLYSSSGSTFQFNVVSANFAQVSAVNDLRTVYLDFGNGDIDTITYHYYTSNNSYSNIKLNGAFMLQEPSFPYNDKPYYILK